VKPGPDARETPAGARIYSPGELVPQPHGGAIRRGSRPGEGGGGRRRNELRKALEECLDLAAAQLQKALREKALPAEELARTVQILGRLVGIDREPSLPWWARTAPARLAGVDEGGSNDEACRAPGAGNDDGRMAEGDKE